MTFLNVWDEWGLGWLDYVNDLHITIATSTILRQGCAIVPHTFLLDVLLIRALINGDLSKPPL